MLVLIPKSYATMLNFCSMSVPNSLKRPQVGLTSGLTNCHEPCVQVKPAWSQQTFAKSMPLIPAKLLASSIALASSSWPSLSAVIIQPFCAPFSRSRRVSLRVSISAMATVLWLIRYSLSDWLERKLLVAMVKSRIISPFAHTL